MTLPGEILEPFAQHMSTMAWQAGERRRGHRGKMQYTFTLGVRGTSSAVRSSPAAEEDSRNYHYSEPSRVLHRAAVCDCRVWRRAPRLG